MSESFLMRSAGGCGMAVPLAMESMVSAPDWILMRFAGGFAVGEVGTMGALAVSMVMAGGLRTKEFRVVVIARSVESVSFVERTGSMPAVGREEKLALTWVTRRRDA